MATVSRQFCRCALSAGRRVPSKRKYIEVAPYRQLSTTPSRLAQDEDVDEEREYTRSSVKRKPFAIPFSADHLSREERESFEALPIAEKEDVRQAWLKAQPALDTALQPYNQPLRRATEKLSRDPEIRAATDVINDTKVPRTELGYWGDDEDDELGQAPDGEDGPEGDMTSIAHDELALHREIREYARLAAWDMPFLSKFAKPFEPPPLSSPLRFRYTTYMGESHPASRKVVVEFSPPDISSLNPQQQLKLKKLVGARYNPDKNIIKMSCEKFETPAQNKRYLGDLIETLVKEAQDPVDTFEDIPLDLRHNKSEPKPQFPEDWLLKEETATKLIAERTEVKQLEEQKEVVDGNSVITQHIRAVERGRQVDQVTIGAEGRIRQRPALRR